MPRSPDVSLALPAAAAVLALAVVIPLAIWRVEQPSLGVSYGVEEPSDGVRVTGVAPGGTADELGVRPGDELVAIGDIATPPAGDERLLWGHYFDVTNAHRQGDTVAWTIRRDGAVETFVGAMTRQPLGLLLSQTIVFGAFWALACFLIWTRRDVKAVRHLAWTVLAVTTGQFLRYASALPLNSVLGVATAQVSAVARYLGPAMVVHFGVIFPVDTLGRRARRAVLTLAYGVPLPLLLVEEAQIVRAMMDPVVPYMYPTEALARLHYRDMRFWVFLSSFIACAALLVQKYRTITDEAMRDRIKWVVWSIGLAAAVDGSAMAVYYYLTGDYSAILGVERFRNYLYLLPVVGIAIAVFRHDLFEVDRVIRRTVANGGTMATIFVLFATIETVVSELLEDAFPAAGLVASIAGGIVAAAAFTPLRRWIERASGGRLLQRRTAPRNKAAAE